MIYEIAGLRIEIHNRCKYTDTLCREYVSADQNTRPDFSVSVSNEAFLAEREKEKNFSDGYIENICLHRLICQQIPLYNRFLLHAAIIEYDGKGIAFLGKSGTGKSTHANLWTQYVQGATLINGDKPIVEMENNRFIVHGTPWQGKENLGKNASVPLHALCFLEQSKSNEIRALSVQEAVGYVFPQILMPSEGIVAAKTLELVDALVRTVPTYLLRCDISQNAVRTAFEGIIGKMTGM